MDLYRAIEDWVTEKQQQMEQKQQLQQQQGHGTSPGSLEAAPAAAAEDRQQPGSSNQQAVGSMLAAAKEAVLASGWARSMQREQAAAADHESDLPTESEDPDFSIGSIVQDDDTSVSEGSDFLTSEDLSENAGGLLSDDDLLGPSGEAGASGPGTMHSSQGRQSSGALSSPPQIELANASGADRYHLRRRPPSMQPT
eukprot:GHUV01015936.1.p2 GENE.GHUV01015936.1~~GHUV01015936.1.p2  ORF type:complete len:197 (+),score=68.56 GHUV01015936.1:1433-2023(+)